MKEIADELYPLCAKKAKRVIWVFSDLQQRLYANAEKCLNICMEDYALLGNPAGMIWYLGDSTESSDLNELYRMTDLQEKAFSSLNIPLCYATGNHDYDHAEYCHMNGLADFRMPFYDMVRAHPGWHTTKDCEETWFRVDVDDYAVYFFCDHVAHDNSWCSTHNGFRYGRENYPYGDAHFSSIRQDMERCGKKHIITAAHCAFPGGNRDTYLLEKLQPLPLNVRLHLYGHSHIGEYRWPGERVFSQIQWVDWQDIPQVDVSSFEDIRGSACRSVILHIYEDDSLGLFFRNHNGHRFTQAYFPKMTSAEMPGNYARRMELLAPMLRKEHHDTDT